MQRFCYVSFGCRKFRKLFFVVRMTFFLKLYYDLLYFIQTCVEVASPLIISEQMIDVG